MSQSTEHLRLSMVVVVHDMARVAPRTWHTLSKANQVNPPPGGYEVIVVDNGSTPPVQPDDLERFGPEFRLLTVADPQPTPTAAANLGIAAARGEIVGVMLDGARMVTPGTLGALVDAVDRGPRTFAALLAWHLGHLPQSQSIGLGYDEHAEDQLLESIAWMDHGYDLFTISCLEAANPAGWFGPVNESTCLAAPAPLWAEVGGFDTRFTSPGGGLANHQLLHRIASAGDIDLAIVLGEGTFHQIHGGVSTNATVSPWERFAAEYAAIEGKPYEWPSFDPIYVGRLGPAALKWIGAASRVDELVRGQQGLAAHAAALEAQVRDLTEALEQAVATSLAAAPSGGRIAIVGAEPLPTTTGIVSGSLVECDAVLRCTTVRHTISFVLDGWTPADVVGERVIDVEAQGVVRSFLVDEGFFSVAIPLVAAAGTDVEVHVRARWTFDESLLPPGASRDISWQLIGGVFEARPLDVRLARTTR